MAPPRSGWLLAGASQRGLADDVTVAGWGDWDDVIGDFEQFMLTMRLSTPAPPPPFRPPERQTIESQLWKNTMLFSWKFAIDYWLI